MIGRLTLLACVLLLSACGKSSLIPTKPFNLTPGLSVSAASVVTGAAIAAAAYFIYDPLAPNWEIEETRMSDDTYRLSLRMKRFHTGGAGESIQIVKRRAAQLQSQLGYSDYQLLEYTEGIDSQTLGAQRVADGVLKLTGPLAANSRPAADSFLQN